MRKLVIVALVALIGLAPMMLSARAQAQTLPQAQQTEVKQDHRLLAVGAGAIIGIVLFNTLTYPFASVPLAGAALAPTPIDIALGSRIVAGLSGGAGALIAHYLYTAFAPN